MAGELKEKIKGNASQRRDNYDLFIKRYGMFILGLVCGVIVYLSTK